MMTRAMQTHDRRATLETATNPDINLDYVISLSGLIVTNIDLLTLTDINLELRYVPDREITRPASWRCYLDMLGEQTWATLEELAVTALTDINNQLIPRWMELSVTSLSEESRHSIVLKENQPDWNEP